VKPKTKKLPPKTRDYAMLRIIQGATKAAVHTDHKKKSDKYACRTKGKGLDRTDE
jgi:hypothetical protein